MGDKFNVISFLSNKLVVELVKIIGLLNLVKKWKVNLVTHLSEQFS